MYTIKFKFEEKGKEPVTLSNIEPDQSLLEVALKNDIEPKKPRKLLRGLWSDANITAEEIDEARKEMWGTFPREDI